MAEFNGDVAVLTGSRQTVASADAHCSDNRTIKYTQTLSNPQIWIRCIYCNQTCTTFTAEIAFARATDHSVDNNGCNVAVFSCYREALAHVYLGNLQVDPGHLTVVYLQALYEERYFRQRNRLCDANGLFVCLCTGKWHNRLWTDFDIFRIDSCLTCDWCLDFWATSVTAGKEFRKLIPFTYADAIWRNDQIWHNDQHWTRKCFCWSTALTHQRMGRGQLHWDCTAVVDGVGSSDWTSTSTVIFCNVGCFCDFFRRVLLCTCSWTFMITQRAVEGFERSIQVLITTTHAGRFQGAIFGRSV